MTGGRDDQLSGLSQMICWQAADTEAFASWTVRELKAVL